MRPIPFESVIALMLITVILLGCVAIRVATRPHCPEGAEVVASGPSGWACLHTWRRQ